MVATLAGDQPVSFQTYDDRKRKPAIKKLYRKLHGTLNQHAETLASLNADSAAICMMVNAGNLKARNNQAVQTVRALFVDMDEPPPDPSESSLDKIRRAEIPPHLITETSPGKFHAFWRVDGVTPAEYTRYQLAMAYRFGGDPSVKDASRVARVAGFLHQKSGLPFQSRIVDVLDCEPYPITELSDALGLRFQIAAIASNRILAGQRNDTLFSEACKLHQRHHSRAHVLKAISTTNIKRCEPPLPEAEIIEIVDNAMAYDIGRAIIYSPAETSRLLSVSGEAVKVYMLARLQLDNGAAPGKISLTGTDLSQYMAAKTRSAKIKELIHAGLLVRTQNAQFGIAGKTRLPELFALPLAIKSAA